MQDSLKILKYNLIKYKLRKHNKFLYNEHATSSPVIFLFFVACGTIVKAEKNFIYNTLGKSTVIVEVPVSNTESAILILKNKIKENDLIVFSGGGYIGDEYIEVYLPIQRILKRFYKNKILFFPQTIFFKNAKREKKFINICKKCKNIKIFVREIKSEKIFKSYGIKTYLVPDIVLSEKVQSHRNNGPILLCMRNDVEKYISDNVISSIKHILEKSNKNIIETDTVLSDIFDLSLRDKKLNEMLNFFSNSSLVVTDRIHGMIFSYLTQTPCIALSNYNHKVKSEYNWIKECNYIFFMDDYNEMDFQQIINEITYLKRKKTIELNSKFSPLEIELKKAYGKSV